MKKKVNARIVAERALSLGLVKDNMFAHSVKVKEIFLQWKHLFTSGMKH